MIHLQTSQLEATDIVDEQGQNLAVRYKAIMPWRFCYRICKIFTIRPGQPHSVVQITLVPLYRCNPHRGAQHARNAVHNPMLSGASRSDMSTPTDCQQNKVLQLADKSYAGAGRPL